jgi:DinB superfamily
MNEEDKMTEKSQDSFWAFAQRMQHELETPEAILTRYTAGADELGHAVAGLAEPSLDLARAAGKWTIRQIVHHVVDGDHLSSMWIRAAIARPGCTMALDWYDQESWAQMLYYPGRAMASALALLRANRGVIGELVAHFPDAWERSVLTTWPDMPDGYERAVGSTLLIQACHVPWHIRQIRETRDLHQV